jgi:hypothetical protein
MDGRRGPRLGRAALLAAALGVSVLAAGGIVVAQVVSPEFRSLANRASARIERAVRPAAATEGTPAARTPRPTTVRVTSLLQSPRTGEAPGVNPQSLFDGLVGERAPAWRTAAGTVQAELRFPVSEEAQIAQVVFAHTSAMPPESWAREVEVWIARTPDVAGEPDLLGRWSLARSTGQQPFPVDAPVTAARARLRVLSNHGSTEFTSLAEFALQPRA